MECRADHLPLGVEYRPGTAHVPVARNTPDVLEVSRAMFSPTLDRIVGIVRRDQEVHVSSVTSNYQLARAHAHADAASEDGAVAGS